MIDVRKVTPSDHIKYEIEFTNYKLFDNFRIMVAMDHWDVRWTLSGYGGYTAYFLEILLGWKNKDEAKKLEEMLIEFCRKQTL